MHAIYLLLVEWPQDGALSIISEAFVRIQHAEIRPVLARSRYVILVLSHS